MKLYTMLMVVGLSTAVGTANAQAASYSQGTFDPSQWSFSTISQSGGSSGTAALSPSGGDPGDAWLHTWSIPQGSATTFYRVANINSAFTYDASMYGPLTALNFSFNVLGISTAGFSSPFYGRFTPTLRQNGMTFFSLNNFATATTSWTAFSATIDGNTLWVDPNNQGSALRPDFSVGGGVMEFGYMYTVNTSCPAGATCTAASASAALDNFSVSAYTTTVPEPSTVVLFGAGLAALVFTQRRRITRAR